jgi:GTP-binding protein Era
MHSGTVAIVGRTNVGKSTFLNAVLGEKLAIVSPLPQTTRDPLLGVLTTEDGQIAFLDTPGLHTPKSELGRRMNLSAESVLPASDAILFMTDVTAAEKGRGPVLAEDRSLAQKILPEGARVVLVLNKVDLVRDKSRLLPVLQAYSDLYPFEAVIPTSMARQDGVDRVLGALIACLPEGEPNYPEDTLTDRPVQYFVREYVREQVLNATRGEVPHAVAVTIDRYEDGPLARIGATIHVEKVGQRRILIGQGGAMLVRIGSAARQRIEAMIGKRSHLELFVRVTERWKNAPRMLTELGYEVSEVEGKALDKPGARPVRRRRKKQS